MSSESSKPTLDINKESAKELRRLYAKAVKDGKDQFVFQDHPLLTTYAKYLIEYIDTQGF